MYTNIGQTVRSSELRHAARSPLVKDSQCGHCTQQSTLIDNPFTQQHHTAFMTVDLNKLLSCPLKALGRLLQRHPRILKRTDAKLSECARTTETSH